MKILTVENLSKSFGGIHANRDISFEVEEGSILGVIGPNGAGKSTLFDLITGFTKPDTGKDKFFDKNGIYASKGTVNYKILEKISDNNYFKKNPPKSLDKNSFIECYWSSFAN